jgi:baculoviral IAP repeat-containing protein 6 (apollon)
MDVDSGSGISLAQALAFNADFLSSSASTTSTSAAAANGQSSSSSIFKDLIYGDFRTDSSKYQLPSLMEDDTDGIEDILDDILEQSKKLTATTLGTSLNANKKDSLPQPSVPARNAFEVLYRSKVSSTMDARLCLDINTEIYLRRLIMKSSINLIASLPHCEVKEVNNPEIPPWPSSITNAWNNAEYQQKIDTNIMLMEVFETIFTDLHLQDSWLNLEQVLQLWLTLNGDNSGNETSKIVFTNLQSKIPFGEKAVNGLLKALASHPALKIRGWCLGFLCLIYSMSSKGSVSEADDVNPLFEGSYNKKIGLMIIQNENFERMLLRFFSGIYKNNSIQSSVYAGPTMCRLVQEMFACLQNKCQQRENLKDIQLRVCHSLIQCDGAISKQLGPIDAQSQLIKELLSYQYQRSDLGIAMSLIENVASLVHHYITNVDKIQCQKSSEVNSTSNNVFGSLFATVLGSESAQSKTVTDSTILMNLLKLSSILVRTKLPMPTVPNEDVTMASSNECQTDEIKAEQQQNPNPRCSPPTFTDNVLQHFPTMNKLLGALSHCNASSAALLVICSIYSPMYNESKNTFSDPMSVEDALFQLIMYMNKLASEPVLVIKPLFDYINYVSNIRHAMPKIYLSEPFLWFILKILETPAALEVFCEMGGIKIIAENLVKSNRTLLNMQPNLVTMIMQHLSKTQNLQSIASGVITKKSTTGNYQMN